MLKYDVFEWVPAESAVDRPIRTKWLDHLKAPGLVRSRCVGMQLKTWMDREDCYAGTPPPWVISWFISLAATVVGASYSRVIGIYDISVAFFHAVSTEKIWAHPPPELARSGQLWLLHRALYGTRVASKLLQREVRLIWEEAGMEQFTGIPCTFYSKEMEVWVTHHGDDFLIVVTAAGQEFADAALRKRFGEACKRQHVVGPGHDDMGRFLNKYLIYDPRGFALLPDPRHTDALVELLGLRGAKGAVTPGTKETGRTARNALDALSSSDHSRYRTAVGILQYAAGDRPDVQYEAKELSRCVQSPTEGDMLKLKRLTRYLLNTIDTALLYPFQEKVNHLRAYADSDWAGDKVCLKSTSSTKIMLGLHLMESSSNTQQILALSSGQAEFYAVGTTTAKALTMSRTMNEIVMWQLGLSYPPLDDAIEKVIEQARWPKEVRMHNDFVHIDVLSDSSAARGMCQRHGTGKVRHLDMRFMWIQQVIRDKEVLLKAVPTDDNLSDMGTKNLPSDKLEKFKLLIGLASLGAQGWRRPEAIVAALTLASLPRVDGRDYNDDEVQNTFWLDFIVWSVIPVCTLLLAVFGAYTLCERIMEKLERTMKREVRPKPRTVAPSVSTQAAIAKRTVMTQSPVTYKTSLLQPTFVPLADGVHGAWVDPYLDVR